MTEKHFHFHECDHDDKSLSALIRKSHSILFTKLEQFMATAQEIQAAVAEVKGKVQQLTTKFLEFDSKLDALKDDPVQLEAARAELRAIVTSIDDAFAAADASEVPPTEPTE